MYVAPMPVTFAVFILINVAEEILIPSRTGIELAPALFARYDRPQDYNFKDNPAFTLVKEASDSGDIVHKFVKNYSNSRLNRDMRIPFDLKGTIFFCLHVSLSFSANSQ